MPAVVWLCGPPWRPGNTALSIAAACSFLHMIMPPRGPRNVLCVVVVTTSAMPTGEGCTPADDEPGDVRDVGGEDGADLVGDRAERREVERARVGGGAAPDELRLVLVGERRAPRPCRCGGRRRERRTATLLKYLPGDRRRCTVGEVAARRQAEAHDGVARLQNARYTARFAGLPE